MFYFYLFLISFLQELTSTHPIIKFFQIVFYQNHIISKHHAPRYRTMYLFRNSIHYQKYKIIRFKRQPKMFYYFTQTLETSSQSFIHILNRIYTVLALLFSSMTIFKLFLSLCYSPL